jgi:hypothetical protein
MYSSYENIAAQKAAIIPMSRCINSHLPPCINLHLPVTIARGRAGSEGKNEADIRAVKPFSETPVDNQAIR